MTGITALLSMNLIIAHYRNWTKPIQQSNIIKIIIMAPLFAVDCYIGLLELKDMSETMAHVLDMVKECYEAIAIHAFLLLMYDLVGVNNTMKQVPDGIKGRELHLPFPLSLAYPGHPHFDIVWLQRLRFWTLQFVIARPILSFIDLLLVDIDVLSIQTPMISRLINIIIIVFLNCSVTTAFFALLTFYHAFENELSDYRPLAKLLCIKGVVFFSTWQGVVLKGLAHFGVLNETHRFSLDEVKESYQDLLVILEMAVIFSPLHYYAFSPKEYSSAVEVTSKKKSE